MTSLPIEDVLPDLRAALAHHACAVLIAPPGAGKTTAVAPALLEESWCRGQILLLSPRRVAARAAAERMAFLAGESVGRRIGYATRMDSRQSADTRILVLTEGIFRSRIIADPDLPGVSAILFDEVHERNLDSDFGLALALDAQAALRPDLRLLAMSATLDGARFARLMGDAPQIMSEGRSFPLAIHHIGRRVEDRIDDAMAVAIRRALAENDGGDILAFLPGVREIDRTADLIAGPHIAVHRLHGQLDPVQQRAALAPDQAGRRKVILATSIAETSLTIDGVRIVIDSGLARRARFDVAAGMSHLVTERASQASAVQRAGRAARQAPGVAYRLWEAAATAGRPLFDPPEILDCDLAPLLIDCAAWGEADPARLRWLDPPPAAGLEEARARLGRIGALASDGTLTAHGRDIARLPMPPALAHMVLTGAAMGRAGLAAELAVLLGERGLGGRDVDLSERLRRWRRDHSARADAARQLARRWARAAGRPEDEAATGASTDEDEILAELLCHAFPDRIARRRSGQGDQWQSTGGRGFRLDPASSLSTGEWLAIADAQGGVGGARITAAIPISNFVIDQWVDHHSHIRFLARYDPLRDKAEGVRERRLGAILLSSVPDPEQVDPARLLLEAVRTHGLAIIRWGSRSAALRKRADFAGLQALSDDALIADLDDWLPVLLAGSRRLADVSDAVLHGALLGRLDWAQRQQLERQAPEQYRTPAGSHHPINYAGESGPTVTARVQAFFGLDRHPTVGEPGVPLVLSLTSPAGKPIQTTGDLPGFWRGSWADVVKDMRGRYPRHPWPDAPWEASATLRSKRASARDTSQ